jgi:hypothetical protein
MLYKASAAENQTPWLVTADAEVQTSRQEKAHVLCGECEDRLNKNGESWMFKNSLRADGSYPLASMLSETVGTDWRRLPHAVYNAAAILKVNISAIAYFAASIFWRASIHNWRGRFDNRVKLGPYEEDFRRYLMGETRFPVDATLWPCIRASSNVSNVCRLPSRRRFEGIQGHSFVMPGMLFTLTVGKSVPARFHEMCFVHGDGNPMLVSDGLEASFTTEIQKTLQVRRQKFP